jgi:hypothetical protein
MSIIDKVVTAVALPETAFIVTSRRLSEDDCATSIRKRHRPSRALAVAQRQ